MACRPAVAGSTGMEYFIVVEGLNGFGYFEKVYRMPAVHSIAYTFGEQFSPSANAI